MCGIFGWVSSQTSHESERILDTAIASMAHRGPDGNGRWQTTIGTTGEFLYFGHTRLAIIDRSGGSQPFHSHDGRFIITFNGEVYNFVELREELVALGSMFQTTSDTEVVVEAFRHWGDAALARFRGMFALAIFDTHSDRLVLARDPVGKKPLFVTPIDGGFAFASEIAALLAHPLVDDSLQFEQVGRYIEQRFIDGPSTFYKSIRKLMPGCLLAYENCAAVEIRYADPKLPNVPSAEWSLEESVERLDSALRDAVRLRMRSDAPFGLFLSGGLDSSMLLGMMSEIGRAPVATFSVGFSGSKLDELETARSTAQAFQAAHHETVIDPQAFADAWPTCVAFRGAPVSEPSDIAIYLLAKQAGRSVKMVLTGEGSDELLCGYPKYWGERYLRNYQQLIPPLLHSLLIHPIIGMLPPRFEKLKIASQVAVIAEPGERARCWFGSGDRSTIERLMNGRTIRKASMPLERPSQSNGTRILQDYDFNNWLPDNLLERADRMMMGGGIEGRMPFMDVELAKVAAQIPERHLVHGRTGKYVLRILAARTLPPSLIGLPKIGFTVPIGDWFRSELKALLYDLLAAGDSRVRQMTNPALVDELLQTHMSALKDHTKLLWSLANLEIFLRQPQLKRPHYRPTTRST